MRKQRASQSWPGKETWSWHQILCCSDEHLAAFLQLGRRRLTDIYLSTFTDLSSFQAGVTEIKEVCHRDPAALRHCLRSRAMHDALASHRQRLRLAGPGRRPCGSTVRGGDTGRNGSNSRWSQRRNHGGGAAARTRGTMTAPVARPYRGGGGNPKGVPACGVQSRRYTSERRTVTGRLGSTPPREARHPQGRRSVEGPPARPAPGSGFWLCGSILSARSIAAVL